MTTTSYGTWCNRVDSLSTSPDDDVVNYVDGGDPGWRDQVKSSGALARMLAAYRSEIESRLPPDISLSGNEFIGPASPDDGEFDGYPQDEDGRLDFAAMVEGIDLDEIVDRYNPDGS